MANLVRPCDLQRLATELRELSPKRCPRSQRRADHGFQIRISTGQLSDPRLEAAAAKLANLQPVATQDSKDTKFDVDQLALQQPAASEQRTRSLEMLADDGTWVNGYKSKGAPRNRLFPADIVRS